MGETEGPISAVSAEFLPVTVHNAIFTILASDEDGWFYHALLSRSILVAPNLLGAC